MLETLNMNYSFKNIAETLIYKIARNAGFSNDVSLLNGKMGIAILLYHGSKYFSSCEMEKIADALISDIIEDEYSLSKIVQRKSCDVFWGLCHLSDLNFIKIDEEFFEEIDDILFEVFEDYSKIDVLNYLFLGNYILLRYRISNYSEYWMLKIQSYVNGMIKMINNNTNIYRFNINLFDSFWYMLVYCKEKGLCLDFNKDSIKEVSIFFNDIAKPMPPVARQGPGFQFYCTYHGLKFEYNALYIKTLSEINALYLNKLLFPDFIMPSNQQIEEVLTKVVSDKKLMKEFDGLIDYQNIGITGYISGLAWSLMKNLQHSKTARISAFE